MEKEMAEPHLGLVRGASWMEVGVPVMTKWVYLKCRIGEHVAPQALLEEFEEFRLCKWHHPVQRRRALTKNESYIAEVQLQLHYSSQH